MCYVMNGALSLAKQLYLQKTCSSTTNLSRWSALYFARQKFFVTKKKITRAYSIESTMAKCGKSSIIGVSEHQRYVCAIVPPLNFAGHKGQYGRIGIVGGSDIYSGAPYFASMAALRLGADLVYVFTTKTAAGPLKAYSPELMIHPFLDDNNCLDRLEEPLSKVHSLVIGPGLSLDVQVQQSVCEIIKRAQKLDLPIVFDASVFKLISQKLELVQGYRKAILTPNVPEFKLLYQRVFQTESPPGPDPQTVEALAAKMGNVTVLSKGPQDLISDGVSLVVSEETGSPRRCGGQGDILGGLLATFAFWSLQARNSANFPSGNTLNPLVVAGLGASMVTRRSARNAFKKLRRSTLTSDILEEIRESFAVLFPVD